MSHTILIVDDEQSIRTALIAFLVRLGFTVITAETGEQAIQLTNEEKPDLVLLDVVLDEDDPTSMSGIEVCREIRTMRHFIPIIMLTSHAEWEIESLGQGAIAFVQKPWDNVSLATQIRTTLSAVERIRAEEKTQTDSILRIEPDILIDMNSFRVSRNGEQVDLTPMEFSLLAFLVRNAKRVWTREQLLDHVWDDSWAGYPRTVDRHIAALRRKLKFDREQTIKTVHGVGYILEKR